MKPKIEQFIVIGDSLSDKGQMAKSILAVASGLIGNSPDNRFTNGFTWDDFAFDEILNKRHGLTNKHHRHHKPHDPSTKLESDTAEGMTTEDSRIYVRTYCIGGLTAFDYREIFRLNPVTEITDLVLSNLVEQREKIIVDDKSACITPNQKLKTLVIEWSGANDLITVNSPREDAADKAITARKENVKKLIELGYRHFVLFNLPDLSLTPRFQNQEHTISDHAKQVVQYFNRRLVEEVQALQSNVASRGDCSITLYDVNQLFTDAYTNPEKYGFDPNKRKSPLIHSPHFKDTDDPDAAKGYMFWDEVHPTEAMHAWLAKGFLQLFDEYFLFQSPHEPLLQLFREAYGLQLDQDRSSWYSCCCARSTYDYEHASLDEIASQGIHHRDARTLEVMKTLGWIDENHQCKSEDPFVVSAIKNVEKKLFENNPIKTSPTSLSQHSV